MPPLWGSFLCCLRANPQLALWATDMQVGFANYGCLGTGRARAIAVAPTALARLLLRSHSLALAKLWPLRSSLLELASPNALT